jgi:hypothetical protein
VRQGERETARGAAAGRKPGELFSHWRDDTSQRRKWAALRPLLVVEINTREI